MREQTLEAQWGRIDNGLKHSIFYGPKVIKDHTQRTSNFKVKALTLGIRWKVEVKTEGTRALSTHYFCSKNKNKVGVTDIKQILYPKQ